MMFLQDVKMTDLIFLKFNELIIFIIDDKKFLFRKCLKLM